MKKLLTILIILTAFSCGAQNIEPLEPILIDVHLNVEYINENEMGLFSKETGMLYKVNPAEVEVDKKYWFAINLAPCNSCKSRTGTVLYYSISPEQASRDIAEKRLKLKAIKK